MHRAEVITITAFLLGLFVCPSCAPDPDDEATPIIIFAAASTTDAIRDLAQRYHERTGVRVECSFGSSATLARQIMSGAPADVFLSANPQWMDSLADRDAIRPDSRVNLLANELVLVAPVDSETTPPLTQAIDGGDAAGLRLAIATPDHVPAGIYARQALTNLGWWDHVQEGLRPALDVRAALRLVEMGEADAGVVYASDAMITPRVRIVGVFPPETHDPIRYPVALCAESHPAATAFLEFLIGPEADAVFKARGFAPLDESPPE